MQSTSSVRTWLLLSATVFLAGGCNLLRPAVPAPGPAAKIRAEPAVATPSTYKGWRTLSLSNKLIDVQIAPAIGGRVIQYQLGDFPFFWVNAELAGKQPPPGGLGPEGAWLNYGGEKLWPAPQGWDGPHQWPGPPDAVLDGSPHAAEILPTTGPAVAVRLTSGKDKRSGIRFSRVIRTYPATSHVGIDATMTNVVDRPVRWGIWTNAQLNAANHDGPGHNKSIRAYCPINPKSVFPNGYAVQFGLARNLSFKTDPQRRMLRVEYDYKVGKVGLDSNAGWCAVVDGDAGCVFVERFTYQPGKDYPDRSSVEFWSHGLGSIVAWGKICELEDDPVKTPYLIESELLSPFATLQPGQSHSFHYDWYAARIGGSYPILDCTRLGVTCERLTARMTGGRLHVKGRFGVFGQGTAAIVPLDARGKPLGKTPVTLPVTPTAPLVIDSRLAPDTAAVSLVLYDIRGRKLGELARADRQ